MNDDFFCLESAHIRARVYLTGALFTEAEFRLPLGRWVRPLAEPPWPDSLDPDLPGHLRRLGGEFFCLPFGGSGAVREASPGWDRLADACLDGPMHGPSANADWRVTDHRKDRVTLAL